MHSCSLGLRARTHGFWSDVANCKVCPRSSCGCSLPSSCSTNPWTFFRALFVSGPSVILPREMLRRDFGSWWAICPLCAIYRRLFRYQFSEADRGKLNESVRTPELFTFRGGFSLACWFLRTGPRDAFSFDLSFRFLSLILRPKVGKAEIWRSGSRTRPTEQDCKELEWTLALSRIP